MAEIVVPQDLSPMMQQTVEALGRSTPIDEATGLRLTESEYTSLVDAWSKLSDVERQQYLHEIDPPFGGPVPGHAAMLLRDALTEGRSYETYRDSIAARPLETARTRDANAELLQAERDTLTLAGKIEGFNPKNYPDANALREGLNELRALRTAIRQVTSLYNTTSSVIGLPRADDLVHQLVDLDTKLGTLRATYARGDRLGYALGSSNAQRHPPSEPPRLVELHHVTIGAAHVRTMTLSQLDALPLSKRPVAPTPPFTVASLNRAPSSEGVTNYAHGDRARMVQKVGEFIDRAPSLGDVLVDILKGLAKLFAIPADVVCALAFGVAKVFGSKSAFADFVLPISSFARAGITLPKREDLHHLTAAQAVLLAQAIVDDALRYDHAAIAEDKNGQLTPKAKALARVMDELGTDKLLERGLGVCRNYAEATQFVFEVIKSMQDPNDNQLVNASVQVVTGWRADNVGHAWCALCVVQPDGSLAMAQFDPTWADESGESPDAYAFGTTTPGVPGGARESFLHAELLRRTDYELSAVPDFLQKALGVKTRTEVRQIVSRELTAAEQQKLVAALVALPHGFRGVVIDYLTRELTEKAAEALRIALAPNSKAPLAANPERF